MKKTKYLGVPLLTNHFRNKKKSPSHDFFTIIFAGGIFVKFRPASFIIRVISLSKRIKLKMYLTAGIEHVNSLKNKYSANNVFVNGPIDRETLAQEFEEADCFLNIGNSMDNQMPSKVFEYMSYGKPIVSTYRIDRDTSKEIIDKYPSGLCIDERNPDLKQVVSQVETFLEQELTIVDFSVIKGIFPECLPSTFVETIR